MKYHGIYTHLKNQEINMLHTLLHGKSSIKAAALKTKKEEFQEIKKEKKKNGGMELNWMKTDIIGPYKCKQKLQ